MSNYINAVMNSKVINTILTPLQSKAVSVPLTVVLILYSSLIAPNPPAMMVNLFKNKIVKVIALFLFVLIFANGDRALALTSMVAIILTFAVIDNIHRLNDAVMGVGSSLIDVGQSVSERLYDGGSVTVMPTGTPTSVPMGNGLEGLDNTFAPIDLSKN